MLPNHQRPGWVTLQVLLLVGVLDVVTMTRSASVQLRSASADLSPIPENEAGEEAFEVELSKEEAMIELDELFTKKGFDMFNVVKEDNGEQYISYSEFSRGFRDKVIGMKDVAEKDLEAVYYAVLMGGDKTETEKEKDVTLSVWLEVTVGPAESENEADRSKNEETPVFTKLISKEDLAKLDVDKDHFVSPQEFANEFKSNQKMRNEILTQIYTPTWYKKEEMTGLRALIYKDDLAKLDTDENDFISYQEFSDGIMGNQNVQDQVFSKIYVPTWY